MPMIRNRRDVMVVITTTLGDEWSFGGGAPAAPLLRGVAS